MWGEVWQVWRLQALTSLTNLDQVMCIEPRAHAEYRKPAWASMARGAARMHRWWASVFNILCALLAAAGSCLPIMAKILMPDHMPIWQQCPNRN